MVEGIFPKVDGQIYFAKDANLTFGITDNFEQDLLNVTTTSSTSTFSQSYTRFLIHNRGLNDCYINFGADATTSDFFVEAGERITVYGVASDIRAITSTGTTDLHVFAMSTTSEPDSISVNDLSASTTSSSVTVGTDSCFVLIKNNGINSAYVNFNGVATTDNIEIDALDTLSIGLEGINSVHAITSSGTTTLSVITSTEI